MSFSAPVPTSPNTTSSAARPAMRLVISSNIWAYVVKCRSSGRYQAAPSELPRGTIVTLINGFAQRSSQLTEAWPLSWYDTTLFSCSVSTLVRFSKPPTMRSMASRKSCLSISFFPLRAAHSAASLHTLAMSAPEKPGVCLDRKSRSTQPSLLTSLFSFRLRICTSKMALRSSKSGSST